VHLRLLSTQDRWQPRIPRCIHDSRQSIASPRLLRARRIRAEENGNSDDPFDQLYGPNHRGEVEEIANVSVVDRSSLGNDNRGVAPGFSNPYTRYASTDADERITPQPPRTKSD